MKQFSLIFTLIWCCSITTVSADSVYSGNVRAELLADVSSVAAGESFWVGLKMTMDEGWHTYWRNSGDSGMSTKIRWSLPDGFQAGEMHWPIPQRFDYEAGLTGYGYEGEVILLTQITAGPTITDDQVIIEAKTGWLSCKEICVPGKADFSINLPVEHSSKLNDDHNHQFNQVRQHWPVTSDDWNVTAMEKDNIYLITLSTESDLSFHLTEITFFPYRNDVINHVGEQFFSALENGYELSVVKSVLQEEPVEYLEGILVAKESWLNEGKGQGLYIRAPVNNVQTSEGKTKRRNHEQSI